MTKMWDTGTLVTVSQLQFLLFDHFMMLQITFNCDKCHTIVSYSIWDVKKGENKYFGVGHCDQCPNVPMSQCPNSNLVMHFPKSINSKLQWHLSQNNSLTLLKYFWHEKMTKNNIWKCDTVTSVPKKVMGAGTLVTVSHFKILFPLFFTSQMC